MYAKENDLPAEVWKGVRDNVARIVSAAMVHVIQAYISFYLILTLLSSSLHRP